MEFRYNIPKHIKGYIEDIPEDKLEEVITFMFELAINHSLLDSPLKEERGLPELKEGLAQLISNSNNNTERILESIFNLSSKIDNMSQLTSPRMNTVEIINMTKNASIEEVAVTNKDYKEVLTQDEDKALEDKFLEDMLK